MIKHPLLAAAVLLAGSNHAFSNGLRVAFMDSFAAGRGNSFTATADSPAALFYNPAGITQLNSNGILAGSYQIQFSSRHIAPDGQITDTDSDFEAVPHLYVVHNNPSSRWAFGIGAHLPFGLVSDWPRSAPFSGIATRSELTHLRITSAAAYQVTPQISLAAGPAVSFSRLYLRSTLGFVDDDELRVKLEDEALGYNLGLLWQPGPRHSFGLTYHSRTTLSYTGRTEIRPEFLVAEPTQEARMSMTIPEIAIAGYSFRPTEEWNLEVNVDWTNWDRLNSLHLHQESGSTELPFHWNSTFMYGLGATRFLRRGQYLSAGYLYSDNAVPAASFNPAVPDSRLHFYTLGAGRRGERLSWHASYTYGYGPTRQIIEPVPAAGHYETEIHGIAISAELTF
jgi:long-chain fatty acid transport protein